MADLQPSKCEFPLVGFLVDLKWLTILSSFKQWCSSYRLANQFFFRMGDLDLKYSGSVGAQISQHITL